MLKGQTTELLARLPEAVRDAHSGARVLILEVENGVATVEVEV